MKIEKINDSTIRFHLTGDDLKSRNITIPELSYGTLQSKKLISELLSISKNRFDFSQDDNTLTIDAVPLNDGSLEITFTKEPYTDALDTRYSIFSRSEVTVPSGFSESDERPASNAREVLDMYRNMRDKKKIYHGKDTASDFSNIIKVFYFDSLEDCITCSELLANAFSGKSSLCRISGNPKLYLVLHPGTIAPEEFNKICNMVSDFGSAVKSERVFSASLKEHGRVIILNNAIERLSELKNTEIN